MKFKIIFIILFLYSCSAGSLQRDKSTFIPYTSKGFALVYDEKDYVKKIVSRKLNQDELQVAHNRLKANSIVTITNPENKKSLTLKVSKKLQYPDFFTVLITKKVANLLELDTNMPFVDLQQRVKNKSFIAKKAVTFSEEKAASNKAPVTKVQIHNISTQKKPIKEIKKFSIIIGEFYSKESAYRLKDRLEKNYVKKEALKVKKLRKNKFQLSAGPYISINTLKNAYFQLNKYGFDNLDIEKK
jgi:hypothetical protein